MSMQQYYYVYVLRSFKDKHFYVGFTKNLPARVKAHNDGFGPVHQKQIAFATCLLGGLSQPDGRYPSRKVLEDQLGEALPKDKA